MRADRGCVTAGAAVCFLIVGLCTAVPAAARRRSAPAWALQAAKIPTPASAKNARAVLLSDQYLITVDAKNHAVERERWAVRVLEPEGRDNADCMVEYSSDDRLHYFRAWTITPDGRQFRAMSSDFKDLGDGSDVDMQSTDNFRVVNPPADDPGSVVACETEKRLQPYISSEDWQFQLSIPVVTESLELALPPGGRYAVSWSHHAPIQPIKTPSGDLLWQVKNMPALNLEDIHATPSWDALAARMSVKWGPSAVNGVASQWRQIGEWMDKLEAGRADPTPQITAKAQALIAGAPDFYTKLSRITSYIQNNIRYFIVVRGIGGFQAHYAADVYRNGYGDCKDKTTLLIAMLKAIGIHAYYLHVDSDRGVINPHAPSLIGDHMVTAIELPPGENDPRLMARVKTNDGKTLLIFDPTDEVTPVGLIRRQLQGAWGNLADGAQSQVIQMPVLPPSSALFSRKGSFTLGADGTLNGSLTYTFTGNTAASERMDLKELGNKDVRKNWAESLGSVLPGLSLDTFRFQAPASLDTPVTLHIRLSDTGYARHAGPLLLIRPRVLGSDLINVPGVMAGKKRKYPIELGHPGRWTDSFNIKLPPGYALDGTPDPVSVNDPFASYRSSVAVKAGVLHYQRDYIVRKPQIPAAQATVFRKLENAILSDERGMVVLKKQ